MPGTKLGGQKAAATNKAKHGEDFYALIGAIGGRNGTTGGFASDKKDTKGLTGPQRASIYGGVVSQNSRRRKNEQ